MLYNILMRITEHICCFVVKINIYKHVIYQKNIIKLSRFLHVRADGSYATL